MHPTLGVKGDGDPLDVIEIGNKVLETGSTHFVKPLGTLAMIDGGELDYKMLVIRESDPLASKINKVEDIDKHFEGTTTGIREWFRWYKTPDNGGTREKSKFGFGGAILDSKKTKNIIEETHKAWKKLYDNNGLIDSKKDAYWVKPTEVEKSEQSKRYWK